MCPFRSALEPRFSISEPEATDFRDFIKKRLAPGIAHPGAGCYYSLQC